MLPDEDGLPTEEELDALQAEIDKETAAQSKRGGGQPTPDDIERAADEFLKSAAETSEADVAAARIEELETELATLKDQALRAMAEAENTRRRAERETAQAKVYGVEKFAGDVLSVYDNLSRALHTIDGQAKDELGDNARNLVEGIELTEKNLIQVLSRHGVRPVPGVGEKFDPNVHQAVAQVPSDEFEKGQVAAVMQQGFTLGERTLRAAMVAVSTGKAG